jgi:hypothetical protein
LNQTLRAGPKAVIGVLVSFIPYEKREGSRLILDKNGLAKSMMSGFRKDPHNPSTFRWGIQAGWAKPIFFRTKVH